MRLVGALLSGLLAFSAAVAQEAPLSFGEAVDVRLVNVDVFVTDKRGKRVSGLSQEDFVVYQDGRSVEVTNFSRIVDRSTAAAVDSVVELDTTLDGEPLAGIGEPLTVVVYVDNSALMPPHRNRVLDEVESFVMAQAAAGLRYMIAVYDPGLKILTPVTVEAERAREVLGRVAEMPARGSQVRSERRQAMNLIEEIYVLFRDLGRDPCQAGWEQMIAAVDVYAQMAGNRVQTSQAGLLGLTRSLGGIPGRKALLYLSDGLEQRPGLDLYSYLGELCPRREQEMFGFMTRWDETRTLQELTEHANAHRVTLYALDTTGLTGYSASSVEYSERLFMPSARNDTLRVSNLQSSLFIIADETGGRAFFNANSPEPELARMAEDFHDYYSLGFAPPTGWDGESHSIRVELVGEAAKGRSLRYRQRYRAIPDQERLAERTLATLVLGWQDNPLGTEIRLGEQRPGEAKTWLVPVEIVVPPGALGTLTRQEGQNQLIRVLMMAEDDQGRRTPMREKVIPLRQTEAEEAAQEPRTLVVNVELEKGRHKIAVGVRDEINRVASFHQATVEVGSKAAVSDS